MTQFRMDVPGASYTTFGALFAGDNRYHVPDYQRAYDWGPKERRDLFEDHPQRFLFGLDIASDDRVDQLDDVVSYYRGVLGELSQATAEKIACKNARALLTATSLPGPSGPWLSLLALLVLTAGMVGANRLREVATGQRGSKFPQ